MCLRTNILKSCKCQDCESEDPRPKFTDGSKGYVSPDMPSCCNWTAKFTVATDIHTDWCNDILGSRIQLINHDTSAAMSGNI